MLWSSTVTARTSGLSRLPWQVGHGRVTMYFSSSVLMYSESVSLYRRSRFVMIPSNVALYVFSPRSWRYRTRTFSSFWARRMYSIAPGGRSRTGVLKAQPWDRQIASSICNRHDASFGILAHGTRAPCWRLLDLSG